MKKKKVDKVSEHTEKYINISYKIFYNFLKITMIFILWIYLMIGFFTTSPYTYNWFTASLCVIGVLSILTFIVYMLCLIKND